MTDPANTEVQDVEAVEAVEADDATTAEAPLVDDQLLIEDVSIDGMCGVY